MAAKPNITELLNEVMVKTDAELIRWEETADADAFTAPMGGSYLLKTSRNQPSRGVETRYFLQIADSEDNVIVSTSSAASELPKAIFERARNQALGIDKAIAAVLDDLKKLK